MYGRCCLGSSSGHCGPILVPPPPLILFNRCPLSFYHWSMRIPRSVQLIEQQQWRCRAGTIVMSQSTPHNVLKNCKIVERFSQQGPPIAFVSLKADLRQSADLYQASTELGFNRKVRIPLGSFQIESEGSGKFPELVLINFLIDF